MIAIFVKSPWPLFYKCGMKTWEIRSYPINYRGEILFIESETNIAICKMELVNCIPLSKERWEMNYDKHRTTSSYEDLPYRKNDSTAYAWVVRNPELPSKNIVINRHNNKPYISLSDSVLTGVSFNPVIFNAERIACKFLDDKMMLYWMKRDYFALIAIINLSTGTTQFITDEISPSEFDYILSQINVNST